ncbi:hypothetical protein VB773_13035 [Haloarculaceae archaeon H-GB2-1]|nr:hypothetical protein [Haloarculaceae archaeon H-GB1-1]MEA5386914.1 hypothetical protein [Haloarculaceae archaeon H-GB11]MEA5408396.1 hypothetical protein [Haloarculaceae archaeon H-GB2-1]
MRDRDRSGSRAASHDDRAVTSSLDYALSLGLATLVLTGLLTAGAGFVDDRRDRVVETQLRVIGQQIAEDVTRADRLVEAGTSVGALELHTSYPERIAGARYTVEVDGVDDELRLRSQSSNVSARVELVVHTDLADTSFSGGSVVVSYDPSAAELEVGSDV